MTVLGKVERLRKFLFLTEMLEINKSGLTSRERENLVVQAEKLDRLINVLEEK